METQIINITKSFEKKEVLNSVSFTAQSGECIGILGTNGSGKSTLFAILNGILKSEGGDFLYGGESLFKNKKLRAQTVGFVPQSTPLIEELTAQDNLSLWYKSEDIKKELDDGVLAMLGIGDFLDVRVSKMSGGMKKRLSIACAVAHHPKILILDEPSASLDIICRERIANYLKEFKHNGGTVLLATHDLSEFELCDKMYIIKDSHLSRYEYDGNLHTLAGRL